jgi:hypothetical protein
VPGEDGVGLLAPSSCGTRRFFLGGPTVGLSAAGAGLSASAAATPSVTATIMTSTAATASLAATVVAATAADNSAAGGASAAVASAAGDAPGGVVAGSLAAGAKVVAAAEEGSDAARLAAVLAFLRSFASCFLLSLGGRIRWRRAADVLYLQVKVTSSQPLFVSSW